MKKLLIVFTMILLVASGSALAQSWKTANQSTVSWDAVTLTADDTPIAEGEITYRVWLANATTDPAKANPVVAGEGIAATSYTITLGVEGRFFAGVQAVRTVDGEVVGESEMSWSDDPLVTTDGKTFGLRYFLPPGQAKKLRIE